MKNTIGFDEFAEGFKAFRLADYFSRNGLKALFGYLGEFERSPVDVCCDYEEYANLEDAANDYGISADELREKTEVIEFEGGVIILAFLR